ncbi:MAG: HEAT repeat domain-containing protein [Deltaproteobacteria bacterium]|nr:HEAT repeat domain-containing protein [Deltaproteobacteria bacterium]
MFKTCAFMLTLLTALLVPGCATPNQTFNREQAIKIITDPPQANLWQRTGRDRVLLGKGEAMLRGSYTVKRSGFNPLFWLIPAGGAAVVGGGAALAAKGGKSAGGGIALIMAGASVLIPGALGLVYRYREKGKERVSMSRPLSIRAELDGYEPAYLRLRLPSKRTEARLKLKPRWFLPLGIARRADLQRPESVPRLIAGLSHKTPMIRRRSANTLGTRRLRQPLTFDQRMAVASALEKVWQTDTHYNVRQRAKAALSFYRRGGLGTSRGQPRRHPRSLKILGAKGRGPIVAVFDLRDRSGKLSRSARKQLSEYWATILAEGGHFKVVPRARVRELLAEQKKKSYKHCYESRCQIQLGRALAAQKAIALSLLQLGKRCTLTARFFDLKTETAERAATMRSGCRVDQLSEALGLLALRLAR